MKVVAIKYLWFLAPAMACAAFAAVIGGLQGVAMAAVFYFLWAMCLLWAMYCVRGMSKSFGWLLSATGTLLIIGCALNIYTWISPEGSSLAQPALMVDYARDYNAARDFAIDGQMYFYGNASYVMALGMLFRLTGPNIAVPLIVNSLIVLVTVIVGARMSVFLLQPALENEKKVAFVSGLAISSVANLILMGTVDLKDAGGVLAFTCMAFALALASRRRLGPKGICLAAVGAMLMIVFKSQLAVFIMGGILIVSLRRSMGSLYDCIYLGLLAMGVLLCGREFQMTVSVEDITSEHSLTGGMLAVPSAGFYGKLMWEYYFWPVWVRIILVPFTAAVQTLMPLPWHLRRDLSLGAFFPYGHFSFPWYILFWAISSFYIFLFVRRGSAGLNRWALFWLVCYCGVAFYSCGTTARYYLPFVPMAVPMAVRAVQTMLNNILLRSKMIVWGGIYTVCLAMALTATFLMLR